MWCSLAANDKTAEQAGFSLGDALKAIAASYTQIPLDPNAPLIPLGDLQATAGYGRGLIVPDDIYPVMSLLSLIGSKNGAKLATGKHVDGALDVYTVNGGSGSGAAHYRSTVNTYWRLNDQLNIVEVADVGPLSASSTLVGCAYSIRPDPGKPPSGGASCDWRILLSPPGGVPAVVLAVGRFDPLDYAAPLPVSEGYISFNPAIDMLTTFGSTTAVQLWAQASPGGITGVAVPNYGV